MKKSERLDRPASQCKREKLNPFGRDVNKNKTASSSRPYTTSTYRLGKERGGTDVLTCKTGPRPGSGSLQKDYRKCGRATSTFRGNFVDNFLQKGSDAELIDKDKRFIQRNLRSTGELAMISVRSASTEQGDFCNRYTIPRRDRRRDQRACACIERGDNSENLQVTALQ